MRNKLKGFLVFDIVFEGQSLNYDQGIGNYQELKKIHKNGRVYTLVSRYALRYSILEQAKKQFNWKLADREILTEAGEGGQKVLQPKLDYDSLEKNLKDILDFDDLNLFGFLITNFGEREKKKGNKKEKEKSISLSRASPVRISHAISLEPYKFDSHFNANLGLARRYYGHPVSQNIFQVEEHRSYYKYNIVIDLNQIGKFETFFAKGTIDEEIVEKIKEIAEKNKEKIIFNENKDIYKLIINNNKDNLKLIKELVEILLNLKRGIKGREENLEPVFMIVTYYENFYDSFLNSIRLETNKSRITEIEEKKENEKAIRIIKEKSFDGVSFNLLKIPSKTDKFLIYAQSKELISDQLKNKVIHLLKAKSAEKPVVPDDQLIDKVIRDDKQEVLEEIEKWLGIKEEGK